MHYRQLGRSGLTVSVIGLGCNNFGGRIDVVQSRSVVDAALIAGATRPEQIAANVAAGEWVLDPTDLTALDALGTDTVRV